MLKRLLFAALLVAGLSHPASAATRFMVACVVTCTWDGSSTAIWSGSSGGAPGSSVPGASDTVTLDASSGGGVATVNTTVTVQSITMGAFTGTLDFAANDNNVTLSASAGMSGTGSGTRTLNMGDGTWTLSTGSASATPWNFATTTNLTFAANASTILVTGAAYTTPRTFAGGGLTYNNLTVSGGAISITGANTFAAVTLTSPSMVSIANATTQTVTSLSASGSSSSGAQNYLGSSSAIAIGTISDTTGTDTLNWTAVGRVTFSGGATFVGTNSFDAQGNTGITITAPTGGGTVTGQGIIGGGM